jgi:lipid-binding SYLF domain-containing protein
MSDLVRGVRAGMTTAKLVGRIVGTVEKASPSRLVSRVMALAPGALPLPALARKARAGLRKEDDLHERLHADVMATLVRMKEKDPSLEQALEEAFGYAVFPAVGKATLVLGGAYGKGEVFRKRDSIGYAALVQLTIGVQVGGQTYSELVLFQDKETLDRFKRSKVGFAANASAVIVKAGAAATSHYKRGMQIYVHAEGGMMLELGIGAQKLAFRRSRIRRKDAPKWEAAHQPA